MNLLGVLVSVRSLQAISLASESVVTSGGDRIRSGGSHVQVLREEFLIRGDFAFVRGSIELTSSSATQSLAAGSFVTSRLPAGKKFGIWARIEKSVWLVESPMSTAQVRDALLRDYNLRIDEIKADKGYGSDANRAYVGQEFFAFVGQLN